MSQENTTATTSEGKNISFSVPKVSNSETKDIKCNENIIFILYFLSYNVYKRIINVYFSQHRIIRV